MYILPPGIKKNPQRRWNLPDRIFFGFGACHILAGICLREFPDAGFRARWIQPAEAFAGFHIYLVRDELAFDFHGYSCAQRLLDHHWRGWTRRFPGWSAKVDEVDFDLLDTVALNARKMLGPDQYFGDAAVRARRFLRRYVPYD